VQLVAAERAGQWLGYLRFAVPAEYRFISRLVDGVGLLELPAGYGRVAGVGIPGEREHFDRVADDAFGDAERLLGEHRLVEASRGCAPADPL
jgi:hypothetical protein